MKETKIYEKILRRLLAESTNKSSNLGAAIKERGKTATAILYDTNSLIELLSGRQEDGKSLEDQPDIRAATLDKVIKGYIKIYNIDDGTCYNTTLVDTIAGPGFGKELYSLGYAMSPTGLLAPARNSVSPEATAAWKKAADRGRKRHKFDDAENPKTPPPEDDCPVFSEPDREHIDYAYEADGTEQTLVTNLKANHEATIKTLSHIPDANTQVWNLLRSVGYDDFLTKYGL